MGCRLGHRIWGAGRTLARESACREGRLGIRLWDIGEVTVYGVLATALLEVAWSAQTGILCYPESGEGIGRNGYPVMGSRKGGKLWEIWSGRRRLFAGFVPSTGRHLWGISEVTCSGR